MTCEIVRQRMLSSLICYATSSRKPSLTINHERCAMRDVSLYPRQDANITHATQRILDSLSCLFVVVYAPETAKEVRIEQHDMLKTPPLFRETQF